MKKLSLIMVLALVITAFTAMLVMNTSAKGVLAAVPEGTELTKEQTVYSIDLEGYGLNYYANDEAAIEAGAIGRFGPEGGTGYASSLKIAAGNASSCNDANGKKLDTFYLLKNIVTHYESTKSERIGNTNAANNPNYIELGETGRKLILDGSLGKEFNEGKNFSIYSSNKHRLIHYELSVDTTKGKKNGILEFQNITLSSPEYAGGLIQVNGGLDVVLGNGCVLDAPASPHAVVMCSGSYFRSGLTIKEGATVNAKGAVALYNGIGKARSNITVEGGTLKANSIVLINKWGGDINISDKVDLTNVNYKVELANIGGKLANTSSATDVARIGDGKDAKALGGYVYVPNVDALSAYIASGGAGEVYLLADITKNGTKAINSEKASLGAIGNTLVFDGSFGQARTGDNAGKNFSITSDTRCFHYGADKGTTPADAATIVFRNISMIGENSKGTLAQVNEGATVVFGEGFSSTFSRHTDAGANQGMWAYVVGGYAKFVVEDGATFNHTGKEHRIFRLNGSGATVDINGGVLNSTRIVQHDVAGGITNINGGVSTATDIYAISLKTAGTINVTGGTLAAPNSSYGTIMFEKADCVANISGGTITGKTAGVWDHVGGNTINVSGGTIDTDKYGLYPNGAGTKINITGGTIISEYGVAIQRNNTTLNISGKNTKIEATKNVVIVNVGDNSKVTIDGGTFVSGGNTIDISNSDGAKDVVENVVVTINGGDFTSENGYVVRSEAGKGNNGGDKEVAANTKVTINGGTFTAKNAEKEAVLQGASAAKTFEIYGGTFNSWNKTAALEGNILGTEEQKGHGNIKVYGVVWTQADAFNIYGGEFNLYKDDGKTLATESSCVIAFDGGTGVNVYGGAYSGGEYLVFKYPYMVSYDAIIADSSKCYKMPEDGTANINITTTKGASVRVDADLEKSGIRFEGTIGEDVFDFITKYVAKATDTSKAYAGIAIVPADYLGENGTNGVFTFDALAAKNLTAATTKATKGLVDNKDGTYTLRLSLVKIREANYSRDFVAIAYVAYENTVIYAPTTSGERSIEFVAKSALADVKPNETVAPNGRVYNTPVTEKFDLDQDKFVAAEAGMASKYNLAQIDLLKAYITVKE